MDAAFIVTFNRPFLTREKLALDYGVEASDYWGKLAADGKCTVPETFIFPTGTFIFMVKGDRQTLLEIISSDETKRLLTKGFLLLDGFEYSIAETGADLDASLLRYAEVGQELALF